MEYVESNQNWQTDPGGGGKPALRKKNRNLWACLSILASTCCLSVAFYGMSTNLVNYIKDRLGEGNNEAANNITNWQGTSSITPLVGAFLADAYLGRYRTVLSFMIVSILGYALLTVSASVEGLKPSCVHKGTCGATVAQSQVFFVALYLIALGGGMQPCILPFGADQFDESDESERRRQSSFFNWFYLSINVGSLIGGSALVWVQTIAGWGWGFGIPALVAVVAILAFVPGTTLYRHQPPGGSPLTRIAQVVVASLRKFRVDVPSDKSLLYEITDGKCAIQGSRKLAHTDKFKFLDKAAVETPEDKINGRVPSPWRLCTVTQVEELKCVLRLVPVLASGIVFSAVYTQMSTTFVIQGDTLDPRMGPRFKIPAAVLSIFDTISVIIWVPIYDRVIVPAARRLTGRESGFTQLTRMGIGLVISMFAMLAAGILEIFRLRVIARDNLYDSEDYTPVSIFWQVPQYFIVGAAETFTFIGQMEFFYDQAPDAMRSLCSGLSSTSFALGNYLSTALLTIVARVTTKNGNLGWIPDNLNRGRLDYFFWLLAVLSFFNFAVYLLIARWYTYKKTVD